LGLVTVVASLVVFTTRNPEDPSDPLRLPAAYVMLTCGLACILATC
tara:strand:+ start:398 stop:535 length:138 start_codon:yes stop_codon:yes gene_type:complete